MSREEEIRDPRVYFAAERTLLAWIRTGIAMMGFGFVVARFGLFLREVAAVGTSVHVPRHSGWSIWAGITLVLLGVWVNVAATFRHFRFRRRFERGEPFLTPRAVLYSGVAFVLALLGVAMATYLVLYGRHPA